VVHEVVLRWLSGQRTETKQVVLLTTYDDEAVALKLLVSAVENSEDSYSLSPVEPAHPSHCVLATERYHSVAAGRQHWRLKRLTYKQSG
jgi:hypothetical protein